MRTIYKAFLFLLIFQMSAIMIASLNVFPGATMYSDLSHFPGSGSTWIDWVSYFFGGGYGDAKTAFTLLGITGLAFIGTGVFALIQGNISWVMMGIFGVMAIHMIGTSKEFFSTMFQKGGTAVVALGICLFVALGVIILFTLIEMGFGGGDSS